MIFASSEEEAMHFWFSHMDHNSQRREPKQILTFVPFSVSLNAFDNIFIFAASLENLSQVAQDQDKY